MVHMVIQVITFCPKYKDEFEWGGVFLMNPDKKYLTDAEYAEMIEKIKANM